MYKLIIFKDLNRSFPNEDDTQILFYHSKFNALERFKNEYHTILEHYNQENSDGEVNIETEGDYCHIYDNSSSWTASITEVKTEDADNDDCIASINWSREDISCVLDELDINPSEKNVNKVIDFPRFQKCLEEVSIATGWDVIKEIISDIDDFDIEYDEPLDYDEYVKKFNELRISTMDYEQRAVAINTLVDEVNKKVKDFDYDNSIYTCYEDTLKYLIEEVVNECNFRDFQDKNNLGYLELRICDCCGNLMAQGYTINEGDEYYCSDECLHKHYTEEEFNELYDNGEGDSYYTEWY